MKFTVGMIVKIAGTIAGVINDWQVVKVQSDFNFYNNVPILYTILCDNEETYVSTEGISYIMKIFSYRIFYYRCVY